MKILKETLLLLIWTVIPTVAVAFTHLRIGIEEKIDLSEKIPRATANLSLSQSIMPRYATQFSWSQLLDFQQIERKKDELLDVIYQQMVYYGSEKGAPHLCSLLDCSR